MEYKLQYKCVKFTNQGSQMKWCQSSFVIVIYFNKNPKNKDGLTLLYLVISEILHYKFEISEKTSLDLVDPKFRNVLTSFFQNGVQIAVQMCQIYKWSGASFVLGIF